LSEVLHVRFGSKAEIAPVNCDVRFTLKADIHFFVPGALTKGLDILQCRGQGARLVSDDHLGDERPP